MKNVAIVILNYTQYISIKRGIDELKKRGYHIDVYCPVSDKTDGFKEMFDDTRNLLIKNGYNVYSNVKNKKYKVLLEPYPSMLIDAEYKIRYRYGMISAKPNIVYNPYNYLMYDAILCSGKYDSNILSVFTKTHEIPSLKYDNFKKKKHNYGKKVLLYLPTYGECSSIDLLEQELSNLRKQYYVIVKTHHGTSFLKDEKTRVDKLKNNVDEYYDCFKSLQDLLSIADVVLTDNSGAIFEAMYTNTPVAVFCDDINKNKIGDFNTTQYELHKLGILPYTNKKNEIKKILQEALSLNVQEKQKYWSKENFCYSKTPSVDFADLIEQYLNDNIDKTYINFHNILSNNYYDLVRQRDSLKTSLSAKNEELLKINKELERLNNFYYNNYAKLKDYENGKLYKMSTKIYSAIAKVRSQKK